MAQSIASLEQQRTVEDLLVSKNAQLVEITHVQQLERENAHLKKELELGKVKIAALEKELAYVKGKLDQIKDDIHRSNPHLDVELHNHPSPPVDIRGGSSAVVGDKVYIRIVRTKTVYEYNSQSKAWKKMPSHPHDAFTLVCVNKTLTTVGGEETVLYTLVRERWVRCTLPLLPTKRCVPAAVHCEKKLVVAGGIEKLEPTPTRLQTVEVLDTSTKLWITVSPLPYGLHQTTAVRCGDSLYIAANHASGSDILKCSWNQLTTSNNLSKEIWSVCQGPPVSNTTLEVLQGHLLAIGGQVGDQPTADVYWYRELLNRWEKIGAMSLARDECRSAVLPNDALLVVGSHTSPSNRRKVDILRLKSLRSQSVSAMGYSYRT